MEVQRFDMRKGGFNDFLNHSVTLKKGFAHKKRAYHNERKMGLGPRAAMGMLMACVVDKNLTAWKGAAQ